MVRLVKGAYWDSEIKRARSTGSSDPPVSRARLHPHIALTSPARASCSAGTDAGVPAVRDAQRADAVRRFIKWRGPSSHRSTPVRMLHGHGRTAVPAGRRAQRGGPARPGRTMHRSAHRDAALRTWCAAARKRLEQFVREPEVNVGSRRIDAQLHAQRAALGQLLGQPSLGQNLLGSVREHAHGSLYFRHRANARTAPSAWPGAAACACPYGSWRRGDLNAVALNWGLGRAAPPGPAPRTNL